MIRLFAALLAVIATIANVRRNAKPKRTAERETDEINSQKGFERSQEQIPQNLFV